MKILESAENYLETILKLSSTNARVRSIDIANDLGYSKPSVSVAMKNLKENGYINIDNNGKWANILECDYFNKEDLELLKSEISSIDIEEPFYVEKALTIYADFIEKHI